MKYSALLSLLSALAAAQQSIPVNNGNRGINPNPDPNFDPATSKGTFGPFIPARQPAPDAVGVQAVLDERTKQAMQLAISNWMTDTGIVSGFLNAGPGAREGDEFNGIADGAFKAEVDELAQKAVLDGVIGSDPRVSVANLTLTNGVFQSVVDNLQIMSVQGKARADLIDTINQDRCVQILPAIDTYMIVAAEAIGMNAQQRRAVRPDACGNILSTQQANVDAFPNVPGVPGGIPQGRGDGIIDGVPGVGQQGGGNLPPANTAFENVIQGQNPIQFVQAPPDRDGNGNGNGNDVPNDVNGNLNTSASAIRHLPVSGSAVPVPTTLRTVHPPAATGRDHRVASAVLNGGLDVVTTPQLDLPEFAHVRPVQ